jgi:hypothetical protein
MPIAAGTNRRLDACLDVMKSILVAAALIALFAAPAPAGPLASLPMTAATAMPGSDIIEVKKKGVRPYGWNRGRKVGWRGRGMPPGQAKKWRWG